MTLSGVGYPMSLGLAYLFFCGYCVRSLFVAVGLPASVGVMATGFTFRFFFQETILEARDDLQEMAFFLVLLIAGLEIDFNELRPRVFIMAFGTVIFEMTGITLYTWYALEYTLIESMVLACVLVSLGDGLVIPKMREFSARFQLHPMPRLVFLWAPLEASFALTWFGILTGFASPENSKPANAGVLVGASLFRILATIICGMTVGYIGAQIVAKRGRAKLANGVPIFNETNPTEAFLMILAIMLFAFGLGKGEDPPIIPMGFAPGSLFQPELLVIVTGAAFAHFIVNLNHEVLEQAEMIIGGVWVFGQVVLFSMLGSKSNPSLLLNITHVFPIMLCGWTSRFLGVVTGMLVTVGITDTFMEDALFCFLSTLPRATIQGALGAVPKKYGFFSNRTYPAGMMPAVEFISVAGRLYIILTSVCGMILLNTLGPKLLQRSINRANSDIILVDELDGQQYEGVASGDDYLSSEVYVSNDMVVPLDPYSNEDVRMGVTSSSGGNPVRELLVRETSAGSKLPGQTGGSEDEAEFSTSNMTYRKSSAQGVMGRTETTTMVRTETITPPAQQRRRRFLTQFEAPKSMVNLVADTVQSRVTKAQDNAANVLNTITVQLGGDVHRHSCSGTTEQEKTAQAVRFVQDIDQKDRCLILCSPARSVEALANELTTSHGLKAGYIRADTVPYQRRGTLEALKSGSYNVLVATEISATEIRGAGVTHIVNYDQTNWASDALHRLSATSRMSGANFGTR